ncbi:hypothetical protein EJB05_39527, partial [Eragrostis curvula]
LPLSFPRVWRAAELRFARSRRGPGPTGLALEMLFGIVGTSPSIRLRWYARSFDKGGPPAAALLWANACKCASMYHPIARGSGICVREGAKCRRERRAPKPANADRGAPRHRLPLFQCGIPSLKTIMRSLSITNPSKAKQLSLSDTPIFPILNNCKRARRGKGEGMLRKERWPCSAIEDMSQGREESVLCMNLSSACGHRATDSPGLSNTGIE